MAMGTRLGQSTGHALRAWLAALTCACAPEEHVEPLPISVCGQDRPKQILALDDDEFVDSNGGIAQFEDRWLFGVRRFEIPLTSVMSTLSGPEDRPFAQLDARLESVGSCGEDRRVVAEDVDFVIPPLTSDDAWLGCRKDTGDFYWIDPDGAWTSRPIGRALFCPRITVRGHDVFFHSDTGDYARAQLREDGVVVDVLVTDVVQTSSFWTVVDGEYVPSDDILLLRGEDRMLVRLDFATSTTEELFDRVDEFHVSDDRRWILKIRRTPNDPNDATTPTATLVDRESLSEVGFVGAPLWQDVRGDLGRGFAWIEGLDAQGASVQMIVATLPSLRLLYLDGSARVEGSNGDDLVVVTTEGTTEVIEAPAAQTRFTVPYSVFVWDDVMFYEDPMPYADLDIADDYRPFATVRTPLATLTPEILSERAFSYIELAGDRWLATGETDLNWLGDLVIVDGTTLDIRRVDDDVVEPLRSYERDQDSQPLEPWRTDDLVYQVHERASDRGGMWRVKFTD